MFGARIAQVAQGKLVGWNAPTRQTFVRALRGAHASTIACSRTGAFVLGIGTIGNGLARAIGDTVQGLRTAHAELVTTAAAAIAVGAVATEALRGHGAGVGIA